MDTTNGTSEFESGDLVSTVTRVMVSQNRLWSDSEEVVALQVFSEVIEMEGRKVSVAVIVLLLINALCADSLDFYLFIFVTLKLICI